MDIAEINVRLREDVGRQASRRLRRTDLVPAILYGRNEPNVTLAIERGVLERLIHEHAYIVRVAWDGQQENVQIREIQYDSLGDDILHVDMVRISLSETVTVSVSVVPRGEAAGVNEGGTLDLVLHELEIECLPIAIPESLRIDVSQLGIGDSLRIADLTLPEGVTALGEIGRASGREGV